VRPADQAFYKIWVPSGSPELELEKLYGLREPDEVQRFLQPYPHLAELLLEAFPYLKKHFGPSPQVELEVIRDPEIGSLGELVAFILTPLSVHEAEARLDRFDDEWFLDRLDRTDGLLNVCLEFI